MNRKLNLRGSIIEKVENQIVLDENSIEAELREEVRFLFNEIKTLSLYEVPDFSTKYDLIFKPELKYLKDSYFLLKNSIYSLLKSNSKAAMNILENQNFLNFKQCYESTQKNNNFSIDLKLLGDTLKKSKMLVDSIINLQESAAFGDKDHENSELSVE